MTRTIRRFALTLVGFALVGLSTSSASAQEGPLRLEDAVRLAVSRNERSRIADLNITAAEAGVEKARSGFLPVVTLAGNDTQHLRSVSPQPQNVGTATLSITQPLLNAPAWATYGSAKQTLKGTRAQTKDDKRRLAFETARAFFGVLTAQSVQEAAKRRLDSAKANLADTQGRVDAGLSSTNDATRVRIEQATATRELETNRGAVENAYLDLAFLVATPISRDLVPPDGMLSAARRPLPRTESLVKIAIARRPDLASKRFQAAAAHESAREPLLRIVPSINLNGQAQATTNTGTSGRWNDETVGVSLTWTLYDAGVRYADKHSRDAAASIADLNVRAQLRAVDSDVRSAQVSLKSAQASLTASDEAMTAARQSAEETEILYRQGLARAIELVDANDQRFLAEVSRASAQYQVALAYLALREAVGLDATGTELR